VLLDKVQVQASSPRRAHAGF